MTAPDVPSGDLLAVVEDLRRRVSTLEAHGTGAAHAFLGRLIAQGGSWSNAAADGWEDWGGGAASTKLEVTKLRADTDLLVVYGYSIYGTVSTPAWNYAISDGTTRFDQLTAFKNTLGDHTGASGAALLTGLAAGSKTLKLQVDATTGTVNTDANDYLWMVCIEIPG